MSVIYSADLRIRVTNLSIIHTKSAEEISQLMDIPIQTIYRWIQQAKQGIVEPKTGYQKGHSHKITDLKSFEDFVKKNEHDSLRMMAQKLNVSKNTVAAAMKKINFSKKKDSCIQRT